MNDSIRIRAKIEGPGITADTLPWPALREFMDAFIEALAAMPGGPNANEVIFEKVADGSAIPTARVPRASRAAVGVLARGPKPSWTKDQRRRAERLYAFARGRSATIQVGERVLRPVTIPTPAREWTLREYGEVRGCVHLVGGREFRVHLDVVGEGIIVCDADTALVKRLAGMLGEEVLAEGELKRDVATGALLAVEITDFRVAPRRRPARAVLAALDAELDEKMRGFDVASFMREEKQA